MTAVVVAMLGIMILATGVLVAVGGYHHRQHSPRVRRRMRRWRFVATSRIYGTRDLGVRTLRVSRRKLADRLSRPDPGMARVRQPLPR